MILKLIKFLVALIDGLHRMSYGPGMVVEQLQIRNRGEECRLSLPHWLKVMYILRFNMILGMSLLSV